MTYTIIQGDSRERLKELPDNSVDAVVTDPPYGLKFMGKAWDYDVPSTELWAECLRVMKPGAHLLAFGGSRTFHRIAVGIEDAGFEIRDTIMWLYGSGFPKSHDVSKAIDKRLGAEREVVGKGTSGTTAIWSPDGGMGSFDITAPATDLAKQWDGWGTSLKPSHEPIIMARKPFKATVADNVLEHGTGAINVDRSRIPLGGSVKASGGRGESNGAVGWNPSTSFNPDTGRWPANTIIDEYIADQLGDRAKFFYCAKASKKERNAGLGDMPERPPEGLSGRHDGSLGSVTMAQNNHPTVKPIELMRYLVRLVTPPNGIVLDPFTGSGSTGIAAVLEGFRFIGIELDAGYVEIAQKRIDYHTPIEGIKE